MGSSRTVEQRLERLREIIPNNVHRFTKTRAIDCVVRELQLSTHEAREFILNELGQLTISNYCNSILIDGHVYDVYGKRIKKIPWYIKFAIFEDNGGEFIYNISFHPTEKSLETRSEVLEKYIE
ncbi:TPA: hypothetical protein ACG3NF_002785 [Legionella pneumophila]|uniref:hypothetical protein n=1 Tax=Legionella pneumophila TaxID=446 RepID=UPI000591331D|nr:hypothetical protein [Legionella pneumophila]HAT9273922.1 hypothetical protein [Legionella pneumophila subsp. pneumophila]MCO1454138.1 hypothetical protein [Legionella pneumophila]MCZ4722739.1 hypothetical protein [Legionella pneumophila]MCZ4727426.1 hypothetical protein [Legionella pneumophila]MCZ4734806.1 hypothetical protein [Legionella pneumophila]